MKIIWDKKLTTKNDYKKILSQLLEPFDPYFFGGKNVSNLPGYYATSYNDKIIHFESFARMMWGYVYLEPDCEKLNLLIETIIEGVNPNCKNYWGRITDYSQIIVEVLPILIFCYQNYGILKSKDSAVLTNIENWFGQINLIKVSNNNWQCFVILINLLLKKMKLHFSPIKIKESINRIEKMYLGNGWYSDGVGNQRDYYISFAIHYYLLLGSFFSDDKEWNRRNKDRAIQFSKSFIYWFNDNGAGLPFGRSLTYKFAQSAFWSILIATKADENNNHIYKGILNRNIRWWMEQDIFDNNGFLTLGYGYFNHNFTEYYNGTSSSYWCLKSFAILLLNSNNSVFSINEAKMPILNEKVLLPEAKMCLCRDNGEVFAFVNGQNSKNQFGHTECKYEKFVYSTLFPFCTSKSYTSIESLACDSNLAISFNGHDFFARHECYDFKLENDQISSNWQPIKGCTIKSIIVPGAPVHIRIHLVNTKIPLELYDLGYAVDVNEDYTTYSAEGKAQIINKGQISQIISIIGSGEPLVINCVPNTNSKYTRCKIPALHWNFKPGNYIVVNEILGSNKKIDENKFPSIMLKYNKLYINNRIVSRIDKSARIREPNMGIKKIKKIKQLLKKLKSSI